MMPTFFILSNSGFTLSIINGNGTRRAVYMLYGLMGRRLQTRVPTIPENLRPAMPSIHKLRQYDKSSKAKAKEAYDRRRGARVLQDLQPGDLVLMKTEKGEKWSQPDTVVTSDPENRTYLVNTPHGTLRRNR